MRHRSCGVGDDERVPRVGLRLPRVEVRGFPHRQPGQVGDVRADIAGHRDRQRTDRVRLVHDDEHRAVLLQVGDDRAQRGLVLGQLVVVDPLPVWCESASVMGGLPDVESQRDGVFGCHDRLPCPAAPWSLVS